MANKQHAVVMFPDQLKWGTQQIISPLVPTLCGRVIDLTKETRGSCSRCSVLFKKDGWMEQVKPALLKWAAA